MVPASKKSIIDAISQFEPRVTVERIDHTFPDIGQVMYHIYLSTVDGQTFQVDYNTAGGNLTPGRQLIILQATYSPSASRYYINLTIDSAQYSGLPAGYPNINALWLWVNEQWPTLGTWRFSPTSNKISVFVYASSGSLVISSLNGVQALFPPLDSGEFYMVQFNGSYSDQGLFTIADVIQWVRLNWGDGGEWSTDGAYLIYQSNSLTNDTLEITADEYGGFSSGFNTGFSI